MEYSHPVDYMGIGDYWWLSFYDYFYKIGIKINKAKKFKELVYKSNIFDSLCFKNIAIVYEHPQTIKKDDKWRLHNHQWAAIEWNDWYYQNYIHWVRFNYEEFEKFKKWILKAKDIINRPNQDQKRVMMMVYGNDKLIKELKAKTINKMKDDNWYFMRLLMIEDSSQSQESERYMVYYEATDPSKNEKIILRVPPEFRNRTAYEAKLRTFAPLRDEYEKNKSLSFTKET